MAKSLRVADIKSLCQTQIHERGQGAFIIGSVVSEGMYIEKVSLKEQPVMHTNATSAIKEAERLVNLHPDKTFVVFEAVGAVRASKIEWV